MYSKLQRALSLVLTILICWGTTNAACHVALRATAATPDYRIVASCQASATAYVTDSIGIYLHPTAAFSSVELQIATYKSDQALMTISIYDWQGTYAGTVATTPLASQRVALQDNQWKGMTFDPLPAGEYLVLAHDFSMGVGVYYDPAVTDYPGSVYFEGELADATLKLSPRCRFLFDEEPSTGVYFEPCVATDSSVTGEHTAPAEYEIPADSLIHTHEVMPDTWVFTDGLEREALTNAEVGNLREDRTLAMFYWTWHMDHQADEVPGNLQELSAANPGAMNDYDNPLWEGYGDIFFWNEPIYGYYRSDDEWVLRRQAELVANAGVDVVFTDNTNGTMTWRNGYTALMNTWSEAMNDGLQTPKVSFMLPYTAGDGARQQLHSIYMDVYRSSQWQSLWYYRDGKPLIQAYTSMLSSLSAIEKEILSFFSFRSADPMYTTTFPASNLWSWLSVYPQTLYNGEQMSVGVALNCNYELGKKTAMNGENVMGRSYTSSGYQTGTDAKLWGYNFAEQFEYALEKDPEVLFVTGWNEWRVERYETWAADGITTDNAFPDQFNDEYSRDIEPSKGDLQDHYYYQLVNFARQYKGARPIPTPSGKATITLDGGNRQWENIEPYYAAYIGNTDNRDAQGYGDLVYTETSGRNDIIGAQIARDDEYVYFHVECAENITAYTDSLWMNLYIDVTGDGALDGWNSFDYVVNKTAPTATTAVLEKFTGDGYASEKVADVEYKVDGRYMTVKIAKTALGLSGDDYTINFSWTDNVHDEGDYTKFSGDILDFYISGDVAPGGRFKYSYISTAENAAQPVEVRTDIVYRGVQCSTDMATASTFSMRVAATVDSLDYASVGFEIREVRYARSWTTSSNRVYLTLNATTSDGGQLTTAPVAPGDGDTYWVAATVRGIPAGTRLQFIVTPYTVDLDGNRIYGAAYEVRIGEDGGVETTRHITQNGLINGGDGFGSEYDWDT